MITDVEHPAYRFALDITTTQLQQRGQHACAAAEIITNQAKRGTLGGRKSYRPTKPMDWKSIL
ncbi:hypothetical protein EB73_33890 [Mycobacterium sp. SWH-M3]|nr:hypothetical protein EB73_33890 [Mycobacterium sp. SWH-M3]